MCASCIRKPAQGSKGVALWPDAPGGIADERPLFTVAYLNPDWSEGRDPQEKFIEQAGKGSRVGTATDLPWSSRARLSSTLRDTP